MDACRIDHWYPLFRGHTIARSVLCLLPLLPSLAVPLPLTHPFLLPSLTLASRCRSPLVALISRSPSSASRFVPMPEAFVNYLLDDGTVYLPETYVLVGSRDADPRTRPPSTFQHFLSRAQESEVPSAFHAKPYTHILSHCFFLLNANTCT